MSASDETRESRVTKCPFRELDECVRDRLPISPVAVLQPTETNQIANRGWRNHYLHHHGASSSAFATATLPLGTGWDRAQRRHLDPVLSHE